MATERKNDFVPRPNATNPEEANDKPRTGIYSAQMNIVFQDQTIMRFSDNPAVVFATSRIEAMQKFEELASRDMEDQRNPVEGKVYPKLASLRFVADIGDAEYVG